MNLNDEVIATDTEGHFFQSRSDNPVKEADEGHSGAHIIQVVKYPKAVPVGEPVKGVSGLTLQAYEEVEGEFEYEVEVLSHHATCDELPYGVECALDAHLCHDGWRELLESSEFLEPFTDSPEGFWKVWVCWERSWVDNWSHYGWDYDQYLDFVRITEEEAKKNA
jgi:hypothetical protein